MASIFSKIAAGEIPSYKCAESDKFYAFLDISPIGKGHTLVIPRKEVDYIFDMEDEDLAEFEVFAKKVAKAIKAAFPCKKVESPHNRSKIQPDDISILQLTFRWNPMNNLLINRGTERFRVVPIPFKCWNCTARSNFPFSDQIEFVCTNTRPDSLLHDLQRLSNHSGSRRHNFDFGWRFQNDHAV